MLAAKEIKSLKIKAHSLKPVVLLGQKGLTPAVLEEIDINLTSHKLMKIKLNQADKASRLALAEEIGTKLQAELIQIVGQVLNSLPTKTRRLAP